MSQSRAAAKKPYWQSEEQGRCTEYVATAKLLATVRGTGGGSAQGVSLCQLTADTTGSASGDDSDSATVYLSATSVDTTFLSTLPLEVVHQFSGPGTFSLSCLQDSLIGGGSNFTWTDAKIIATQVSALSNTAVTG
jgi:hypothetical protein